MIDLTQKILSLDSEAALNLTNANAASIEVKREADLRAEQLLKDTQQLFEKQKNSEAEQLAKNVKEDRERVLADLQKKMEAFDKDVEIDELVEYLVGMAKDRICR